MNIFKFFSIILTTCTSLALANPTCILEIPTEMEVSLNQVVCNDDGMFLHYR